MILVGMGATEVVVGKAEKFRPERDLNPDLCDAGGVLDPLSYEAN